MLFKNNFIKRTKNQIYDFQFSDEMWITSMISVDWINKIIEILKFLRKIDWQMKQTFWWVDFCRHWICRLHFANFSISVRLVRHSDQFRNYSRPWWLMMTHFFSWFAMIFEKISFVFISDLLWLICSPTSALKNLYQNR